MVRSTKLGKALPIPCDGPLDHLLNGNLTAEEKLELENEQGVRKALELLLRAKTDGVPDSKSTRSASECLWTDISNVGQMRDQLQALQRYRSAVLHSESNGELMGDDNDFVGTYRILLELVLSHDVSSPLRRAAHSSLDALTSIKKGECVVILKEVVESLWFSRSRWSKPVGSLFQAMNYEPIRSFVMSGPRNRDQALMLLNMHLDQRQSALETYRHGCMPAKKEMSHASNWDVISAVEDGVLIASVLKLFMTPILPLLDQSFSCHVVLVERIKVFLVSLLWCRATSADGLSIAGVAHGQALFFVLKCSDPEEEDELIAKAVAGVVKEIRRNPKLPASNAVAIVQGIAATAPHDILARGSPAVLIDPLGASLLEYSRRAFDSATRLSSLRGLQTMLNRCRIVIGATDQVNEELNLGIKTLADETLELALQAWECPSDRQVASSIPGLFKALVHLLKVLNESSASFESLVYRILEQPPNRKGKYIALEIFLPLIGATELFGYTGETLVASLVSGICDRGNNAAAIAELLGKILCLLRLEMDALVGSQSQGKRLNKKERLKMQREFQQEKTGSRNQSEEASPFQASWTACWAPHFANALMSQSASRRNQAAAFCIPLLVAIVGGMSHQRDASYAFSELFDEIEATSARLRKIPVPQTVILAEETLSVVDRATWASLETANQALNLNITNSPAASQRLRESLCNRIPLKLLRDSLTHSSASIRLAAIQAMEILIPSYRQSSRPIDCVVMEAQLYEFALPYSLKSGSKDYTSRLSTCLSSLLRRLSACEADLYDDEEVRPLNAIFLPRTRSFVCDFIVPSLLVGQGAYPGTVHDKEVCVLALFRSIVAFVALESIPSGSKKVPRRRLVAVEKAARLDILRQLVEGEPVSALFSLLHSMWDQTRSLAFVVLCDLVNIAHEHDLLVSSIFTAPNAIDTVTRRGLYLASSPRQRESDTGARILAFLYVTLRTDRKRSDFLGKLVEILSFRVDSMGEGLSKILGQREEDFVGKDGRKLPLGHGLLQGVRLIVEFACSKEIESVCLACENIAQICCRAIEVSMDVVADLKDVNRTDSTSQLGKDYSPLPRKAKAPLNVNTGAIGANSTFSSVELVDDEDLVKHVAAQRVIVGSWLLIKEACATLAAAITTSFVSIPDRVIARSCSLLIDMLTSIKHQGAAFAAHNALQMILLRCFALRDRVEHVGEWRISSDCSERLLTEISTSERVRDSTLRRSTGYALGFLSIMRAECASKVKPKEMFSSSLSRLLRLSLPHDVELLEQLSRLKHDPSCVFTFVLADSRDNSLPPFIPFASYESRCRVHALNVLRLVILDAPLASEVKPFIGDALISAMIGYSDSSWAVRNSSTMVFAAIMLRVVDADKNARTKDATSGNAVSAAELFQSYQYLDTFLRVAMDKDSFAGEEARILDPPLFPILLVLSRLQPVAMSGRASASLMDPFVPLVFDCLGHRQHKVRVIAARAIANIASNNADCGSSPLCLLRRYFSLLSGVVPDDGPVDWNARHGALLGIYYLIHSSDSPGHLLKTECIWVKRVLAYARLSDSLGERCPPPCGSVALDILFDVASRETDSSSNEYCHLALAASLATVRMLNGLLCTKTVGAAELGSTAACIACKLCSRQLWEAETKNERKSQCLEYVEEILGHDAIDVRLAASKAFKKSLRIYYRRYEMDASGVTQIALKARVVKTLQRVIRAELRRGYVVQQATRLSTGTHPPTVRRLSRCVLECADGMGQGQLDGTALWADALEMLGIKSSASLEGLRPEDPLTGNAIEFMALALSSFTEATMKDAFTSKAMTFACVVLRCVQQSSASWRLRYSVAVSIEKSRLLLHEWLNSGQTENLLDAELCRKLQLDMYCTILLLIQDSDSDVRKAAAHASLCISGERQTSLVVLEKAYGRLADGYSSRDLSKQLLRKILDTCAGLETFLHSHEKEIQCSRYPESEQDMCNTGTDRRIFEEEDANTFDETLLTNHLRVAAMVSSSDILWQGDDATNQDTLRLCRVTLDRIRYQHEASLCDVAHELTRNRAAFPMLHSLLLASIVVIYLGTTDTFGVREQARNFLDEVEACPEVHPFIGEAVGVLWSAEQGGRETKKGLLKCCFLLPSYGVNV